MLTNADVEMAADFLLTFALLNDGQVSCESWVMDSGGHDTTELAIDFGLRKYLATDRLLVRAYMNCLFYAASRSLESRNLGTLKKHSWGHYFEIGESGEEHCNAVANPGAIVGVHSDELREAEPRRETCRPSRPWRSGCPARPPRCMD
jgi:hypothetical protein